MDNIQEPKQPPVVDDVTEDEDAGEVTVNMVLPPMATEMWEQKQQTVQDEIRYEIGTYLEDRDALMRRALPLWCVSVVERFGQNVWTNKLLQFCRFAYRITVEEIHEPPNKRNAIIRRRGKIIGVPHWMFLL